MAIKRKVVSKRKAKKCACACPTSSRKLKTPRGRGFVCQSTRNGKFVRAECD